MMEAARKDAWFSLGKKGREKRVHTVYSIESSRVLKTMTRGATSARSTKPSQSHA